MIDSKTLGTQLVDSLKHMTAEQVVEFAEFVVERALALDDEDEQAAVLELANVLAAVARKKLVNVKPRPQRVERAGGIDSREAFGMKKRTLR